MNLSQSEITGLVVTAAKLALILLSSFEFKLNQIYSYSIFHNKNKTHLISIGVAIKLPLISVEVQKTRFMQNTLFCRYCHFPQELVLKFKQRSNIEKIQLLCHEYRIRNHYFIGDQIFKYFHTINFSKKS